MLNESDLERYASQLIMPEIEEEGQSILLKSKILIIGAGVAGLQAIATARRLGAIVSATDVRAASKEQVDSLGGKFLTVEQNEDMKTAGGYAKEASDE